MKGSTSASGNDELNLDQSYHQRQKKKKKSRLMIPKSLIADWFLLKLIKAPTPYWTLIEGKNKAFILFFLYQL